MDEFVFFDEFVCYSGWYRGSVWGDDDFDFRVASVSYGFIFGIYYEVDEEVVGCKGYDCYRVVE